MEDFLAALVGPQLAEPVAPAPILDMRHMLGDIRTARDAWGRWAELVAQRNVERRRRMLDDLSLHETGHALAPEINHGRWLAICPCGGGIACWPAMDAGACMDCAGVYRLTWPAPAVRAEAEELLSIRPERHRNWRPPVEPLDVLRAENEVLLGVAV